MCWCGTWTTKFLSWGDSDHPPNPITQFPAKIWPLRLCWWCLLGSLFEVKLVLKKIHQCWTSTVFATVSGDGRVTVFDLSTDKYTPVCRCTFLDALSVIELFEIAWIRAWYCFLLVSSVLTDRVNSVKIVEIVNILSTIQYNTVKLTDWCIQSFKLPFRCF